MATDIYEPGQDLESEKEYYEQLLEAQKENPLLTSQDFNASQPPEESGWYTPTADYPASGPNPYSGDPSYREQAAMDREFIQKYGRRPTGEESSRAFNDRYAGDVSNPYSTNIHYQPGSTMYELGFRTPKEYGGGNIGYGPWTGRDVPDESVTISDIYGNPYRRYPNERAAQWAGYGDRLMPELTMNRQRFQPTQKTGNGLGTGAPQIMTIQDYSKQNPSEMYLAKLDDYLTGIYNNVIDRAFQEYEAVPDTDVDAKKAAYQLYQQREREMQAFVTGKVSQAEAGIQQGVPTEQLYGFNESANAFGENARSAYQKYVTGYNEQLATFQQGQAQSQTGFAPNPYSGQPGQDRYVRTGGQPRKEWAGSIGAMVDYGPINQAPIVPDKAAYDRYIGSLGNIGEASRIWMQESFPQFVETWRTHGQGQDFTKWVNDYLISGGKLPGSMTASTRRFAPYAGVR
jgi:hypothetical protein